MAKAKMGAPSDKEIIKQISAVAKEREKAKTAYEKAKSTCRQRKGVFDELSDKLTKLSLHAEEPELFNQPESGPDPEDEDDEDFDDE